MGPPPSPLKRVVETVPLQQPHLLKQQHQNKLKDNKETSHLTMIITTTTTLVVKTHTMIFTMMVLETRKSQNHQAHLSQSHRQFHLDIMETQPNPAAAQLTVEYTPEAVSMLLPVILNLMHQHQEFQTTGSAQSTL